MPASDFALPGRRYPIEDQDHAREALANVARFGSPTMQHEVKEAVTFKFKTMGDKKK